MSVPSVGPPKVGPPPIPSIPKVGPPVVGPPRPPVPSVGPPQSGMSAPLQAARPLNQQRFADPSIMPILLKQSHTIPTNHRGLIDLLPSAPKPMLYNYTGLMRKANSFDIESKQKINVQRPKMEALDIDYETYGFKQIARKMEVTPRVPKAYTTEVIYDKGQFTSLQDCINKAQSETAIKIPEGVYDEKISITKDIHLIGQGKVIFKAPKDDECIFVSSAEVNIEGIKFKGNEGCKAPVGAFINCCVRMVDCSFSKTAVMAILFEGSSCATIERCKFKKANVCGSFSDDTKVLVRSSTFEKGQIFGLYLQKNTTVYVEDSTFAKNGDSGICMSEKASLTILNSNIVENGKKGFDITSKSTDIYIEGCKITDGKDGILFGQDVTMTLVRNTFQRNQLMALDTKSGNKLFLYNNEFSNTTCNAYLFAQDGAFIYSEGDTFSGDSKAAVAALKGGKFLGRRCTFRELKGCGILTYDQGTVEIRGCTFEGLNANCIQAYNQSMLRMIGCTFSDSASPMISLSKDATGYAGRCNFSRTNLVALEINDIKDFTFKDCVIQDIKTVGSNIKTGSTPHFIGCSFENNGKLGVEVNGSTPTFEMCTFIRNGENGVNVVAGATPKFKACRFEQNNTSGISVLCGQVTCANCLVNSNAALGLNILGKSQARFQSTVFSNNSLNIQISEAPANVSFVGCRVINSERSGALISNEAVASFEDCFFDKNSVNCTVSKKGQLTLQKCLMQEAGEGCSVVCSDNGSLIMEESEVIGVSQVGVLVRNGSTLTMRNSKVLQCGVHGVSINQESKFTITDSEVCDNGQNGLEVNGGDGSILSSLVTGNGACGITIRQSNSNVVLNDNRYAGNRTKDVQYK